MADDTLAGMTWAVFLTRTADKMQRKLDKPLRLRIWEALQTIATAPKRYGTQLSSPLSSIYSHHLTYQGREFRIAYQLQEEAATVLIVLIGPHENFYRRVKQQLDAA